jgi:hypothetical protein
MTGHSEGGPSTHASAPTEADADAPQAREHLARRERERQHAAASNLRLIRPALPGQIGGSLRAVEHEILLNPRSRWW